MGTYFVKHTRTFVRVKLLCTELAPRKLPRNIQYSTVQSKLIRVRTLRVICRLTNLIVVSTIQTCQPCLLQSRVS